MANELTREKRQRKAKAPIKVKPVEHMLPSKRRGRAVPGKPVLRREVFEIEGRLCLLVEFGDKLTKQEIRRIDAFLGYVSDTINGRHAELIKEQETDNA